MTPALRRTTAAALALALVTCPLQALAQTAPAPAAAPSAPSAPGEDAVAQASAHFARGVKLYQEDDFRAALIEFNRAYELAPNWAVLYDLGQSQYQLREYAGALRTLEKYVEQGGDKIPVERRAQVDREIGELHGRVARVTALTNPDGAEVTMDDAPLPPSPDGKPHVVGAGRHRFAASRPGFVPASKVVDIAGGDELTVRLDLAPETALPLPVTTESPSYGAAVVTGLVGVAGIAVGTVFGVLALGNKSSLHQDCNSDKVCPPSSKSDIDDFSRNGAISTVGFGVGAAGLVLGAYFFFHERGKGDGAAHAAGRGPAAPRIVPRAGGLAFTF